MVIYFKAISGLAFLLVLFTIVAGTPQCPKLTECPYRAENCTDDTDCAVDSLCCESPCGSVCAKQLNTGCETLRRAASRRAKALGVDAKSVRSPRCSKSGAFEPIQCDNEIVSSCWCVDEAGFEMAGTRAPAVALVNCTAQKDCAFHTCRMFCEHGFALADDGCPLCRCRDPCENIKCPNSLACHLEKLACSDPPCPPVPTCKRGRSLENICPVGEALRISETVNPFLCGTDPGKPTCPPLYQCLVDPGNDYGVCCPASLKLRKPGSCPVTAEDVTCGSHCTHDLECQSVQKCCESHKCGSHCVHPSNVTECFHQRALSELLAVSERAGKGYIPQCTSDGQFEPKQCSRNGLVCWCVDRDGHKVKGSMGAAVNVSCAVSEARDRSNGRSLNTKGEACDRLECAAVCEYGFKLDPNGCPTCKCDDPCEGYTCPEDEECVPVKEANCSDFLCPTLPVCRPRAMYVNPCALGTPLTDDITGTPITCSSGAESESVCPTTHACTAVKGSLQSVCCLLNNTVVDRIGDLQQSAETDEVKEQTMCQYLHDFSESMEGTREGMKLALPPPTCDSEGNFRPTQCHGDECWCVDQFGSEIPKSRAKGNATDNCDTLREELECLDLTCRMSCDYGFEMSEETRCPTCQCRDPCLTIGCGAEEQCQLVEVSCKDHYCPPVPACLPKKMGQCPYLVPPTSTSCDFDCNSDLMCNGTTRCCSNGCGTQCIEPLLLSACQHQRSVAQHQAHESGTPAGQIYIPRCREDGSYEPSQCNPGTRECWCVDFRGFEISKTRTSIKNPLPCDSLPRQSQCPLYKCAEDCEHGFELDEKGCRTCTCIDPCSKVSCRGEGESCRLVNVECVDSPCPAVPMCLPKKENPCQTGQPLKIGYTEDPVACGPDFESCPSSHKCQLSPLGEYAVCCPKPREVCFESVDNGQCFEPQLIRNLSRWYFNPRVNKCEKFTFGGCQGNHNNFQTEEMCKTVCPVLSQCERLREKNQKSAERFKKPTFMPRCEPNNGLWQPVQCLEHVGVCWCVNPQGEPLKGTLVRGKEPECNFRQARNRARNRAGSPDFANGADLVLEELMMQLGSFDLDEEGNAATGDMDATGNELLDWKVPLQSRCESLGAQCDSQGQFLPSQCDSDLCWCVDEAGNQLAHTSSFKKGEHLCLPTPVESVDVTLGFRGEYDDVSATPVTNQINKLIKNLQGIVSDEGFYVKPTDDALYISFSLIGANKVDVAFRLEQMVTQQRLPGLVADITRSRFIHKLGTPEPLIAERIVSLEHREIVSQSPVSMIAPYHTALIVIAAASAFVISVLTLLVILYRRKIANLHNSANKIVDGNQRFLSYNRPIYIELPKEKVVEQLSVDK